MNKKILLGLTTTPKSDWRKKIKEIDDLHLREIALFPTAIEIKERKEFYKLLEKTKLKKIPHVHLRDDMKKWELDFFIEKYNTQVFNIHPRKGIEKFLEKNKKFVNQIYVENLGKIDNKFINTLSICSGICVDVSHWEDGILIKREGYGQFLSLVKKYQIGCCHISAIKKEPYIKYDKNKKLSLYSNHTMENLDELKYIEKYIQYLPNIISIELENSFEEQLKVKDYLEKIINKN